MEYYFADGDQQKGPYAREALAAQGVKPDSLVWREGMAAWERADSLAELRDLFAGRDSGSPGALGGSAPVNSAAGAAPYPTSPQPYTAAPAYSAPAAYGTPAYGTPAYGTPAYGTPAYGATGQQLSYGGYSAAAGQASGMAMASMILGILSVPMMCAYLIGTPCALLAVIFGHIARGKARRGEAGGDGMALAGLICGYISLGLMVIGIVFFVVIAIIAANSH